MKRQTIPSHSPARAPRSPQTYPGETSYPGSNHQLKKPKGPINGLPGQPEANIREVLEVTLTTIMRSRERVRDIDRLIGAAAPSPEAGNMQAAPTPSHETITDLVLACQYNAGLLDNQLEDIHRPL